MYALLLSYDLTIVLRVLAALLVLSSSYFSPGLCATNSSIPISPTTDFYLSVMGLLFYGSFGYKCTPLLNFKFTTPLP